jgi:hypothetical protein
MAMHYVTQAIVCLANDLRGTAEALHWKRENEGDLVKTINQEEQIAATVHYYPAVDGLPRLFTARDDGSGGSRLIIVGHGNPESTHIMGDGFQWEPEVLNEKVEGWLNRAIINRISLHMCFGGGNPTGRLGPMPVAVEKSFAMEFAKVCRVARSITARTEVVNIRQTTGGPADVPEDQWPVTSVHRTVGGQLKEPGMINKYVFMPQADGRPLYGPLRP